MAIIPYDRITNLQNDQALAPSDPYPAQKLDQEYNALKITTDDIIQHLDLIQRDDGQLENDSVGLDQLREEVQIGFNAPHPWVTNHDYILGDTVFNDNKFWYCLVAHTSTIFYNDHASGYWSLIADFTGAATIGAAMYVSDGPPVGAQHGAQWFESDTGKTYVYYDDGTSAQWIHTNGAVGSGGGESGGGIGTPTTVVTTGSVTVAPDASLLLVNAPVPASTDFLLPALALKAGPVTIWDAAGTFHLHTYRALPNGSDPFMSMAAWPLSARFGKTTFTPTTLGWMIG